MAGSVVLAAAEWWSGDAVSARVAMNHNIGEMKREREREREGGGGASERGKSGVA
jgi:hypothetical protein